jgi:hypothetical protein
MIKGRYGWYPCDWETFKKLKELNKALTKARHQKAAWERWYRKMPHNRVMRTKLKDSNGRTVGYAAPVPMPEPKLCPLFCEKYTKKVQWDKHHVYHKGGVEETFVDLTTLPIEKDYRLARYPAPAEEACEPLSLQADVINELYAKLCK